MSLPSPRHLFRAAAAAEMVTWAGLLGAMALKYGGATDAAMPLAGGVHGFVFLCYAAVTVAVWIDGRWPTGRGLTGLASAVVPFMTIPFERAQARRGEPADRWRVLDRTPTGHTPAEPTAAERLLARVLRRPAASATAALAVVVVVFLLLLAAGPPTEWGR
ncbi:DUF3817 domain-containing protein [Micrococcus sp.]|uniref:DUF3817 domain-containing protein n=1 Tax=Micrococcus sp. TaxID=1271 RepID=UPI002A91D33B|nr:DUF3817 domain-containing protein [Micrococcus sp.]MDY6055941.1 DUF3817 domain-containing protein [Micrococcus sp.]